MRDDRLWRRMVGVEGTAVVEGVDFDADADEVVVSVRRFRCEPARCGRCNVVAPGYDHGEGRRRWRAWDGGSVKVFIEADAPRVCCPTHGPTVAAVPWARHDARHTRDFDATVAWLVLHCAKSAIAALARVGWRTVGSIIDRVMADADAGAGAVAADRLANVRRIGIDEVSYARGHKYLVVVVDHGSGRLLWVGQGRDKKTLAGFFDILGEERCQKIALASADGADWIADLVALRCGNARLCMDPFHVVKWANEALDQTRRRVWRHAQQAGYTALSKQLKHARYALVKNPEDLTSRQTVKLARIRDVNSHLYRAYLLKEQLRQVFGPGDEDRITMLDEWLAWARRCQIPEFVELARKTRRYRDDIANTLTHRLTNGPVEGLNSRIRHVINIAHGFRNINALIALIRLHLGGYHITLPHGSRQLEAT